MKTVYIFLSRTNTFFSRLIGFGTRSKFTHASISLDKNYDHMYSFARKGTRPFPAGFKEENIRKGLFGLKLNTYCLILALDVSDEEYENISYLLKYYAENEVELRYSYFGAFLCWLRIKRVFKNKYFCSQFVSTVLKNTTNAEIPYPPCLMRPKDMIRIPGLKKIYEGNIRHLINLTDSIKLKTA